MNYKHEYMTPEFSDMLNEVIVWYHETVCEEYHIIKVIEQCADEMTEQIIDLYKNLTLIQRVNETYFKTKWYIKSKINDAVDVEESLLTKTPTNHQIMFSFQKMKDTIDLQNVSRKILYDYSQREALRKDVFRENLKEDNPKILISFQFIQKVIQNDGREILKAMMNHELRHVIDQYILETYNTLDSKKNSLNSDFKNNCIFDVTDDMREEISRLFYYMSQEEQKARIQSTWSLCQNIKANKGLFIQLTASLLKVKQYRYAHDMKQLDDNYRTEIVAALRAEPFKYVHQLSNFRMLINELFVSPFPNIHKELLVIGYYLNKHSYLLADTSNSDRKNKSEVRQFFSEQNVREKMILPYCNDDKRFYVLIDRSIERNYQKYQNVIYNTIGMNIEKLFKIRHDSSSVADDYEKMAADNDLCLSDYEVGLINEAYNSYQYTLKCYLNNTLVWY